MNPDYVLFLLSITPADLKRFRAAYRVLMAAGMPTDRAVDILVQAMIDRKQGKADYRVALAR